MKVTVRTSLRRYGTDRSAPTGWPPSARHVWPVTPLRWRSPGNPATPFLLPSTTTCGACARAGAGPYAAWVPHGNLHGRTCGVSHAGMRASALAVRSRRTSLPDVARKAVRCTARHPKTRTRLASIATSSPAASMLPKRKWAASAAHLHYQARSRGSSRLTSALQQRAALLHGRSFPTRTTLRCAARRCRRCR